MRDARTEYADIIDREHHVSGTRPQMPRLARAAQFAPYAALTGYDDLIRESERETEARTELGADGKEALNRRLVWLLHQDIPPAAAFTCFVPDEKKAGGGYVTVTGSIVRWDALSGSLTLDGGETICIEDVRAVECEAFPEDF